jgi:hypothetical protein
VLTPYLTQLMADARIADLRASAARHRSAISDDPWSEANRHDHDGEAITLRCAGPADEKTLARLASLDSTVPPAPPVLIAEVGGDIYAALSLHDDTLIADPFRNTMAAQQLLRARAAQLHGDRRPSWRRRLLNRANPWARGATPAAALRGAASQSNR